MFRTASRLCNVGIEGFGLKRGCLKLAMRIYLYFWCSAIASPDNLSNLRLSQEPLVISEADGQSLPVHRERDHPTRGNIRGFRRPNKMHKWKETWQFHAMSERGVSCIVTYIQNRSVVSVRITS